MYSILETRHQVTPDLCFSRELSYIRSLITACALYLCQLEATVVFPFSISILSDARTHAVTQDDFALLCFRQGIPEVYNIHIYNQKCTATAGSTFFFSEATTETDLGP